MIRWGGGGGEGGGVGGGEGGGGEGGGDGIVCVLQIRAAAMRSHAMRIGGLLLQRTVLQRGGRMARPRQPKLRWTSL